MRAYAILFVLGAILGTALDHMHVAGGILSYPHPAFCDQAIWVPLLFGFATVALGNQHRLLRRWLRGERRCSTIALVRDGAIFFAAYAASAFARLPSALLLVIFIAAYMVRVAVLREPAHRIVHALLCGAIGVVVESLLVGAGAFRHHAMELWNVPLWIPGLYMHAAPFLGGIDDLADPPGAIAVVTQRNTRSGRQQN